jgi:hypothetical protein
MSRHQMYRHFSGVRRRRRNKRAREDFYFSAALPSLAHSILYRRGIRLTAVA